MKKRLIALALAALLIFTLASCKKEEPNNNGNNGGDTTEDLSLEYITEKGAFILGLDDSFPPMGFRDDNNEVVGFDIDVAKAVAEKLGVELVIQPIEWSSNLLELNSKNIDCIWNGMSVTPTRQENMEMSVAYLDNNMALVVNVDSGIASLADMEGKKLAVQAGSSAVDAIDNAEEFKESLAEIVELSDNLQCLLNLESNAVDAVLMDDVVARYMITSQSRPFEVLDDVLESEEYAIGFRKGEVALRDAVNNALSELKAEGAITEIATKWFGSDVTKIK
ncbi:MAG: amino acid ABC transporter substrate-binding protein [Eubacteriaceae bacterium]|nr:amino acid ABC transporter substrate-binding protein [Eubacteriaceae bacterium]